MAWADRRSPSEVLGDDHRDFDEIRQGIAILEARGVEDPTVGQAQEAALGSHTAAIDGVRIFKLVTQA